MGRFKKKNKSLILSVNLRSIRTGGAGKRKRKGEVVELAREMGERKQRVRRFGCNGVEGPMLFYVILGLDRVR